MRRRVVGLHQVFETGEYWGKRLVAVAGPGVTEPALVETVVGYAAG